MKLDEIRHTTPHCRPKKTRRKTKQLREKEDEYPYGKVIYKVAKLYSRFPWQVSH